MIVAAAAAAAILLAVSIPEIFASAAPQPSTPKPGQQAHVGSAASLSRVPVFVFGEDGAPSAFREPAIIMLPDSKNLLAFAERGLRPFVERDGYASSVGLMTDVVSKLSSE